MPQETPDTMEPQEIGEAIRAYRAENCPSCGVEKSRNIETFCEPCFERLTPELQERISDHKQYIATFHSALIYLSGGGAKEK